MMICVLLFSPTIKDSCALAVIRDRAVVKEAERAAARQAKIDAGEDPDEISEEEEEEEEEEVDLTIRELQPSGHWEEQGSEARLPLYKLLSCDTVPLFSS